MQEVDGFDLQFVNKAGYFRVEDKVLLPSEPFMSLTPSASNDAPSPLQIGEEPKEIWGVRPFIDRLKSFWEAEIKGHKDKILFGFLAYDFAGSLEPLVKDDRKGLLDFPKACFVGFEKHEFVGLTPGPSPTWRGEGALAEGVRLHTLIPDAEYKQMVEKALELIKDGELYEINLSRPFLSSVDECLQSADIAKQLWDKNPAPFSACFPFDSNKAIISASPECFFKKRGNKVHTFPIKGTRRRSVSVFEDQKLIAELLKSPKELAEHLMVVDLERNDLGRIAVPSTVKVEEFAKLKSYEFVHHLVSDISCELRPELDIFDAIKAMFPSGSITGAPKIRTMQAIRELEPFNRQAYTGALGYIDSSGDGVFSILIRSLFRDGQKLVVNVGGGIVADSCPAFECEETYVKLKGLTI
ncbi:MAG: chorismate-binding protein [Candidatus Caenarcaniphilales bacterium]|nr:chorismate-binding protein [Candidatus Caenarcaniphilales bacterium]